MYTHSGHSDPGLIIQQQHTVFHRSLPDIAGSIYMAGCPSIISDGDIIAGCTLSFDRSMYYALHTNSSCHRILLCLFFSLYGTLSADLVLRLWWCCCNTLHLALIGQPHWKWSFARWSAHILYFYYIVIHENNSIKCGRLGGRRNRQQKKAQPAVYANERGIVEQNAHKNIVLRFAVTRHKVSIARSVACECEGGKECQKDTGHQIVRANWHPI